MSPNPKNVLDKTSTWLQKKVFPISELYTTVMSLVINSQELDNLSPHLSYLISFSAPFFFAKWPISNLIVSCTLFNLNLQLRVQLTCSLVSTCTFSSTRVFKLNLGISITRNTRYNRNGHFQKFLLHSNNFGNIRMHFLIAHLRELITDHREK